MYPKIVEVKILDNYVLLVRFDNNAIKKFDISQKLCEMRFAPLKDKTLFENLTINQGGYGISWSDEVDISEYEIWTDGEAVNQ